MVNRVTPSLSVRRENRQWWRVSILRTRSRPMPWPFFLVEKKGVKSWLATSGWLPAPLSATTSVKESLERATVEFVERHGGLHTVVPRHAYGVGEGKPHGCLLAHGGQERQHGEAERE